MSHSSDLDTLKSSGLELQSRATEADAAQLRSQLDHVNSRYETAGGRVYEYMKRIREVPEMIDRFYETHKVVVDWVKQIDEQLAAMSSSSSSNTASETDQQLQVG